MRTYLSLLTLILTGIFLLGCDNPTSPVDPAPQKVDTVWKDTVWEDTTKPDTVKPSPKVQTCLEAVSNRIPKGTFAQRVSTLQRAPLDSMGCFSFNSTTPVASRLFAARSVAEVDSIIFYNDSALFSITIPFLNNGDTIQVVPTVVSLRNVPDAKVDSVFLAVFDRVNILSRKVKLRRADFGDSSEYGRTLWSIESSNPFQIHFEIHSSQSSPLASSVISAEPGGTVSREYIQIRPSAVPTLLNITDSIFFYSEQILNFSSNAIPKNTYSDTTLKIQAYSIYGIASIKVNNIQSDSIPYFTPDSMDYVGEVKDQFNLILNAKPAKTFTVTVTDSAGYIENKVLKVWSGKTIIVDGYSDAPRQVNYNTGHEALFLYH